MFFLPGRKIAAVIKMAALIIQERDQLEKFVSAWAVGQHTIICRRILRRTSSCGLCKARMFTVLISCFSKRAETPRIHKQKMRWRHTGMSGWAGLVQAVRAVHIRGLEGLKAASGIQSAEAGRLMKEEPESSVLLQLSLWTL